MLQKGWLKKVSKRACSEETNDTDIKEMFYTLYTASSLLVHDNKRYQ